MEKGLLIDAGRKFWSMDFLKDTIKLMNRLSMTHLQLHFSENLGFRIEYPGLSLTDNTVSSYSLADLAELVDFARQNGIELVPSFDSPGHLAGILTSYPEFALQKADGSRELSALDVTNPEACAFIFAIYERLAELFPSKIFHIGGDEFIPFDQIEQYPSLQGNLDAYVTYINRLVEILSAQGKTCRIWNDGFFRQSPESNTQLTDLSEVCYWTNWDKNMAPVKTWLDKGYSVINYCDNYLYYVLGEAAGYNYPTAEKLENWSPELFSGGQKLSSEEIQQVKGCYFSVWSDIPDAKSEDEVFSDLTKLIPVFVKKINRLVIKPV